MKACVSYSGAVQTAEYTIRAEGSTMAQHNDASDSLLSRILKEAKPVRRDLSLYLEPEDSPFSSPLMVGVRAYELMVARSLLEVAGCEARSITPDWLREERASLVCLPSSAPEWALWVVGVRRTAFLVLLAEADKS